MARLSRHVRLVYLVALFQLLGGPAVLCGVIGLARLASDRQLTLAEHAARGLARADGKVVPEVIRNPIQEIAVAPHAPADGSPTQAPAKDEWKPTFKGILHRFQRLVIGSVGRRTKGALDAALVVTRRVQPPPLPPPRLA